MPENSTENTTPGAPLPVHVTAYAPFPGTDPLAVHRILRGELGEPNLAVFPQLPDRGVGADPIGQSAALLAELGFDLQPHGWRVGVPDGIDARRARSLLRSDVNLLADVLGAEAKPARRLKLDLLGPWTLAASLYTGSGERVSADHGARRDVIEAYAHGVGEHLARLRRLTGLEHFTVQFDEPLLPAVHAGTLPTASGYRTLRSIPADEIRRLAAEFFDALAQIPGGDAVRCSARIPGADPSWAQLVGLLHQAGATGWVVEPKHLDYAKWEKVAGMVEAGDQVFLETITPGSRPGSVVQDVKDILRPWRQLGLPLQKLHALTLMPAGSFYTSGVQEVLDCLAQLNAVAVGLEQTRVDA